MILILETVTSNTSAKHYAVIAERLNCTSNNTNAKVILSCLRDVLMEKLLNIVVSYKLEINSLGFLVLYDALSKIPKITEIKQIANM
jgi:hypothetical protein